MMASISIKPCYHSTNIYYCILRKVWLIDNSQFLWLIGIFVSFIWK